MKDGLGYNYHIGNRKFEFAELKTLGDAVQSIRFFTKVKSKELIKKLNDLANKYMWTS